MNDEQPFVIITGSSGFVGSAVAWAFVEAGIPVVAVARRALVRGHGLLRPIVVGDYADVCEMPDILSGARAFFHFADQADRRRYDARNRGDAAVLAGKLAAACRRGGVGRFVLASSIYAGQPDRSDYGWSKRAAEKSVLEAATQSMTTIALRFPPIYGPGSGGMFAAVARHVRTGYPLPLAWATRPRQFLAIANLCDLASYCAASALSKGGVFVPTDPKPVSLRDLALTIGETVRRRPRLFAVPFIDAVSKGTMIDPVDFTRQLASIDEALNWRPSRQMTTQIDYLSAPSS